MVPMFSAVLYFADHGVNIAVNPISVDETELLCQWFVHEDAVEGVDYDVTKLIEVFDVTNREDIGLTEANHRETSSRRFVPGPNSPTRENFLDDALSAYLRLMDDAA
jgi:Rieske 2Fe-2S family protein